MATDPLNARKRKNLAMFAGLVALAAILYAMAWLKLAQLQG